VLVRSSDSGVPGKSCVGVRHCPNSQQRGGHSAPPASNHSRGTPGIPGCDKFLPLFCTLSGQDLEAAHRGSLGNPGQSTRVEWSPAMAAAFQTTKDSLCRVVRLVHPSPGVEISLIVDASNEHVGAALQQQTSSSAPWQPLGFFF
jgi:hypothetical protein